MTKLSKCLWHLDIISFLNFVLCSFWDIQGSCWCTVFGDSGGPLVEMILYKRVFYYGLMETFESSLCALVPLPRSPLIHQTWFTIKWFWGLLADYSTTVSQGWPKRGWEECMGEPGGIQGWSCWSDSWSAYTKEYKMLLQSRVCYQVENAICS